MEMLSRWLRAPSSVLFLFAAVVALPAVTLVYLGLRLLDQDRALAAQHRAEVLQDAIDRVARALETDLTAEAARLSDPMRRPSSAEPDTVYAFVLPGESFTVPAGALAYYPEPRRLKSASDGLFSALDAAEFRAADLDHALILSRRMVGSADAAVRAAARQREARILRKLGRPDEALASYDALGTSPDIALDGEPADLFARRARCSLLKAQRRGAELRQESDALARDLDAGRWQLDRASYDYVSSQIDDWSMPSRPGRTGRETLAAAVAWLAHAPATSGSQMLTLDGRDVTVVWAGTAGRLAAFVAGPEHLRTRWVEVARKAAPPAGVALVAPGRTASRDDAARSALVARRSPAESRLPWTIEATLPTTYDSTRFGARRRLILTGLAAVLVLVGAGSYLVIRSRQQEMALAQVQSDFVAAVSHEFRTPLTSLRQFNEMLADADDLTPEKHRAYHRAQTRATERLHRLVESLLDFGRMEAGKRPYRFEPVEASAFVRDLVDDFGRGIEGRGFDLRLHVQPGHYPVNADPEALGRALWNLLENAVKYSGNGREIDVRVASDTPRIVLMAVRDNGIGIPKDEQGRIVKKFVRGRAATAARIKGTGIGLAMTAHIVRAHCGTLQIESVEDGGSTFTIALPKADELGRPHGRLFEVL